jgi:hypothetical protein
VRKEKLRKVEVLLRSKLRTERDLYPSSSRMYAKIRGTLYHLARHSMLSPQRSAVVVVFTKNKQETAHHRSDIIFVH